jgi:hypothetical protein
VVIDQNNTSRLISDSVEPMNKEMKVLAANRDPGIDTIEGETNLMI